MGIEQGYSIQTAEKNRLAVSSAYKPNARRPWLANEAVYGQAVMNACQAFFKRSYNLTTFSSRPSSLFWLSKYEPSSRLFFSICLRALLRALLWMLLQMP